MRDSDYKPYHHLDDGKPRVDLLQFRALLEVAKVMTWAEQKYGERNWEHHAKKWTWGQLFGSAGRHLFYWIAGENNDPQSGLNHLAHAAWNVLSLLELVLAGVGLDNRMLNLKETEDGEAA
jgi:hypothetical protein